MPISKTLNNVSFDLPELAEDSWGEEVTNYLIAIADGCLQKSGGAFTLTNDVDFGANFGLKSVYYASRATAATAGTVRLGNGELVSWRNAANNANIYFRVNGNDEWDFNGVSQLATAELGHLAGVTSAIQTQLDAKAVKGAIVNADINAGADIDHNKMAALTPSRVLATHGSGRAFASDVTVTELDYLSGVSSSVQTQLNGKQATLPLSTKGDVLSRNASTYVRLGVGTDGQVLSASSAADSGLAWISPLVNPMSAVGDLIRGGASGAATRLVGNVTTTKQFLAQTGDGANSAAPAWGTIAVSDLPLAAGTHAISAAYTVLDNDGYKNILCTAGASGFTVTLPTASANTHRIITIKKVDAGAGALTIDGEGAETIDGAATTVIGTYSDASYTGKGAYLTLLCDGTAWHVIGCGGDVIRIVSVDTATNSENAAYADAGSKSIPPGKWQFHGGVYFIKNDATSQTNFQVGVTTSSASGTGYNVGLGTAGILIHASHIADNVSLSIPGFVAEISSATTYYLGYRHTYGGGQAQYTGHAFATRVL